MWECGLICGLNTHTYLGTAPALSTASNHFLLVKYNSYRWKLTCTYCQALNYTSPTQGMGGVTKSTARALTTKGQGHGALTPEPEDKETLPREGGKVKGTGKIQETGLCSLVEVRGTTFSVHHRFPNSHWGCTASLTTRGEVRCGVCGGRGLLYRLNLRSFASTRGFCNVETLVRLTKVSCL